MYMYVNTARKEKHTEWKKIGHEEESMGWGYPLRVSEDEEGL